MTAAISVEDVWKSYRLGSGSAYRYETLRDAVTHVASRLLRLKQKKQPPTRFWALEDVSFQIEPGETVGLIGRNGAGKTTTLKVISRITLPSKGRAVIRGRVGSLLEVGTGFHPELTGRENIMLNGAILGMSRREILDKTDQIIDFASFEEFIDTPVKRYSSGMSMRLAFSVAAHLEPEIMLVDEVLAVGDQEFQRKCLARIAEIGNEGRTVVFVSHNLGAIERVCARAILLNQGRVLADGPTRDVVGTYHQLTSPHAVVQEDRDVRNVDKPEFYAWRLDSPDAPGRYSVISGSPCEFIFKLALPEPLTKLFFGMAVSSSENTLVSSLTSFDIHERYFDLDAGLHEIVFRVPSIPLGRGQYRLRVSLNQFERGTISRWEGRPDFEVLRRTESRQVPAPLEGLIILDGGFEIRPGSARATA